VLQRGDIHEGETGRRRQLEATSEVHMHAAVEEFLGISEVGEILLVQTWVASFGFGDEALENSAADHHTENRSPFGYHYPRARRSVRDR
jgi:hypothetical protein